ncbi:histidine phosphatase [Macrolepiota fuliginosa MF-IS2]|uniref:Histidine phosphatase n=1 Tax=Macrolepiota fuliginosa MF-IS2 TaxID=1400762 RepID=A0A9P6C440_9AGAR|nr:histidine phosphatase [Macrolepiota fuliginosa MF-IS2]
MSKSFQVLLLSVAGASAAVVHFPPSSTNINNLTFALSGTGPPGIFNSSVTPNKEYGTYNWCNMPHVRTKEYKTPSQDFELTFVELIHRHHKRTPYASNTFPVEGITWDCNGTGPVAGLARHWQASTPSANPFTTLASPGFVGSTYGSQCQFPSITGAGLDDSLTHGVDLRGVYSKRLGLKDTFDPSEARIRVTNNAITSQVASGLLRGLFPKSDHIQVQIESSTFDSLEPTYSCSGADSLRNNFTTGSGGQLWQQHLTDAAPLYNKLDNVSGIPGDDFGWHMSFDHYYDNMSAKQCHAKPLPCNVDNPSLCVTQDEADTVFRLGNWEYSYLFRDAPDSAAYSALRYGAFALELKSHLQDVIQGKSTLRYVQNIAHDGSVAPLLGLLQIDVMVWPGMGSEVVFELYRNKRSSQYFIRVLWSGQPMKTSTPLGVLDMVKIEDFFNYLDSMVGSGSDLVQGCSS